MDHNSVLLYCEINAASYTEHRINPIWYNWNSTYDWEWNKVEVATGKSELDLNNEDQKIEI